MSRTIAFLDACVLYPFSLRDVLIQFSVEGMFQAKWSAKVQAEVIKNVEGNNPGISGRLNRTFELMERAVPDFRSEPTQNTLSLVSQSSTDPKDVEILAAAIDAACIHFGSITPFFGLGFATSATGAFFICNIKHEKTRRLRRSL